MPSTQPIAALCTHFAQMDAVMMHMPTNIPTLFAKTVKELAVAQTLFTAFNKNQIRLYTL